MVGVVAIRALKSNGEPEIGEVSVMKRDAPGLEGIHVLVVDDHTNVREQVTRVLKEGGARVTTVGSAQEALEEMERGHPHVLVTGLAMPGRGGYWLIDRIRDFPPDDGGQIPAVAITACTGPANRANLLRAGFQDHVEKPIDPRLLVSVVSILAGEGIRAVPQAL
jgi:CheY-like chemotaxis protein